MPVLPLFKLLTAVSHVITRRVQGSLCGVITFSTHTAPTHERHYKSGLNVLFQCFAYLPTTPIRKELEMNLLCPGLWGAHLYPIYRPTFRTTSSFSDQFCFWGIPIPCQLPLWQMKTFFTVFYFPGTSTVKPRWARQLKLRNGGEACSSKRQASWKNWPRAA